MKICIIADHIYPQTFGGMEKYATFLAHYLKNLGNNVDVVCAYSPDKKEDIINFNIISVGWTKNVPGIVALLIFSFRSFIKIKKNRYDVIYSNNDNGFFPLLFLNIPHVVNPHGLENFKYNDIDVHKKWVYLRGSLRRWIYLAIACKCNKMVSLGGKLTEDIKKYLHINDKKIFFTSVGITLSLFKKNIEIKKIPNSFLFVGKIMHHKGITYLVEAFKKAENLGMDTKLFLIGAGPLENYIKDNESSTIKYLGKLSDEKLLEWYNKVDAFILPTLGEGMPTVILEAMAMELPTIATNVGAVSKMVDESNGYLIESHSSDAIFNAINNFSKLDITKKQQMSKRSGEKVKDNYTWEIVTNEHIKLFNKLIGNKNGN